MSEIDSLLNGAGIAILAFSLPAVISPKSLHNQSKRNRDRRLSELEAGAEESFFEEKRELEAYTPRFDLSNRTIRIFGVVGCLLGLSAIFMGS